jgi:hypothetical protein
MSLPKVEDEDRVKDLRRYVDRVADLFAISSHRDWENK